MLSLVTGLTAGAGEEGAGAEEDVAAGAAAGVAGVSATGLVRGGVAGCVFCEDDVETGAVAPFAESTCLSVDLVAGT